MLILPDTKACKRSISNKSEVKASKPKKVCLHPNREFCHRYNYAYANIHPEYALYCCKDCHKKCDHLL